MDLAFFKGSGKYQLLAKGDVITLTHSNASISFIYYLESGIASLSSVNEKGEKQTFQYFTKASFLNIIPYLTRKRLGFENDREVEVVAKTECTVWKVPVEVFDGQQDNPIILNLFLDTVLQDYIVAMDKQQNGATGNTMTNLCRFIDRYARDDSPFRKLDKVFTYAEIASFLQVHEVSVARLIKTLKEEAILTKDGHEIVIVDEKALASYL